MLIELARDVPEIQTFEQLHSHVVGVMKATKPEKAAMVLGPMTPRNGTTLEENFAVLKNRAVHMSRFGLCVLEITSFQVAIERLLGIMRHQGTLAPDEYPRVIIDAFTGPLISSGHFHEIHFRDNWQESYGATLEHEEAVRSGLSIKYFG